jgi:hypothetical protein
MVLREPRNSSTTLRTSRTLAAMNSAVFSGASGPGQARLFHTPVWASSHGTAILTVERSSEVDHDSSPPSRRLTRRPSRRLPGVAPRGPASQYANQTVTGSVRTANTTSWARMRAPGVVMSLGSRPAARSSVPTRVRSTR